MIDDLRSTCALIFLPSILSKNVKLSSFYAFVKYFTTTIMYSYWQITVGNKC